MKRSTKVSSEPSDAVIPISVSRYRRIAQDFMNLGSYNSALFLSDKLSAFTKSPKDIYSKAKCLYAMEKYHTAISIINASKACETDIHCRYMLAKCLFAIKDNVDALSILNNEDLVSKNHFHIFCPSEDDTPPLLSPSNVPLHKIYSAMLMLKGQIFEVLENRKRASTCFIKALYYDIYCSMAIETLADHQMLTGVEFNNLLTSLPWDQNNKMHTLTRNLYTTMLSPLLVNGREIGNSSLLSLPKSFKNSCDIMLAKAEQLYNSCNYTKCLEITTAVLRKESFNTKCLLLHTCCLIELGQYNQLFYLAHNLLDKYPDAPISSHVIGSYYYMNGKQEYARRYISKAISKDPMLGPSWLIYGHSFASDNEHDQAMTAYFKANELMIKNHLPLLYIGLECGFNNNTDTAYKFLQEAYKLAPRDPFLLHELGVTAYQSKKYVEAENYCLKALELIKDFKEPLCSSKWEPLFNNLGHIYRRLGMYEKALEYHQRALNLEPINPSTLAYIGFLHAIMGNNVEAVEALHKSIGIRIKDQFTITLLNNITEKLKEEIPTYIYFEFTKSIEKAKSPGITSNDELFKRILCSKQPLNLDSKLLIKNDNNCEDDEDTEENKFDEDNTDGDSEAESIYD